MSDRLTKILVVVLLLVVGTYVVQPYLDRLSFSASTPRTVEPRGNLADIERTTIELFERISPSVVQVVARAARSRRRRPRARMVRRSRAPVSSGTPPATSSPTTTWSRAPPSPSASHPVTCAGEHRRHGAELRPRRHSRRQYPIIAAADSDRHVRRPQGRAGGVRHRQPVRARSDPHHRHHQRAQAPAADQRRPRDHQHDPDRCRHQSRQLGRPAAGSAGRVIGVNTAITSPSGTSAGSASPSRSISSTAWFPSSSAGARCRRRRHRRRERGGGDARGRRRRRHSHRGRLRRRSAPACAAWTRTPAGPAT